ncbi:MAG TPA: FeoB-associated Cys-rich membrane protein [Pirellulales bacterium]|jgi:hypothetical protein
MTPLLQNVIVLAVVAAAAGWLAYRAYATLARKRKAGCGACSNCPVEGEPREPQVIGVETLIAPRTTSSERHGASRR